MSDREREIAVFNLCKSLVDLFGKEQAIANLDFLYERHPEMFRDKEEVREVIEKVVSEPDLIMKNPYFTKEKEILVAKKLDTEKMGDVIIKNKNGENEIFHANKKRMRDFNRLERIKEKMEANGGDALSLHTAGQAYTGANVVSSTLSSASSDIITQNASQTTNTKKIFSKNPKPTQETRDKLQAKMREVASRSKESNHTKDKGDRGNERS